MYELWNLIILVGKICICGAWLAIYDTDSDDCRPKPRKCYLVAKNSCLY